MTMARTKDALEILDQLIGDDAELRRMVEEESVNAAVAQMIYDARASADLTQKQLADLIGTKQPVIARLEDANYDGHSLSMLNRIAKAMNQRLTVQMTAREPKVDAVRYVFHSVMQGLRREKGLTIHELAERAKIKREELLAIERNPGYRPSPLTLQRLADFYAIPQRRLAELAGAVKTVPEELQQKASCFAAQSESFARLTREEKKVLDEFVKFLREEA
jgi:transcriptional regulator with XRE-family HTH domain